MRAKEFLELYKVTIPCYDTVKSCVYDLYQLRSDKYNTQLYFDQRLFADARCRSETSNYNGLLCCEDFVLYETEISIENVSTVRKEILNAIYDDETFIFAYNILVSGNCKYTNSNSNRFAETKEICCNTENKINDLREIFKEDYPKDDLVDYLLDSSNEEFYESRNQELDKGNKWWLKAFNSAYKIFDLVRIHANNSDKAKKFVTEFTDSDQLLVATVVQMVVYLTEKYDLKFDNENEQQKKERTRIEKKLSIISKLIKKHILNKQHYQITENKSEIEKLQEEIEELNAEVQELKEKHKLEMKERDEKGFSVLENNIYTYYIYDELGLNFDNSTRVDWAKLLTKVTGKNEENIRKTFKFDYKDFKTREAMNYVAELIKKLHPKVYQKIMNDLALYAN